MGELSDRFAGLMARMAKSDAELFRTLGEQSVSMRQIVDELTVVDEPATAETSPLTSPLILSPAALLPPEECTLKALKMRFGKVSVAQEWLEEQLGPGPKRATWAVIEQTCRSGSWPAKAPPARSAQTTALTLDQLDQRLAALEQRLTERLVRLELCLMRANPLLAQADDHREDG